MFCNKLVVKFILLDGLGDRPASRQRLAGPGLKI